MENELSTAITKRLINDDISALGELYDILGKKIYNRCSFILKNDAEAADAMQDIFLKAFARIQSISDPGKIEPWLNTICYNHCMDILRKRSKERTEEFTEDHSQKTENIIEELDRISESEEAKAQLNEIIEELNEMERLILVMHYWEGYTVQEIAENLDLGLSAVKMKLVRSRDKMKQSLLDKGYSHGIELTIFLILFLI